MGFDYEICYKHGKENVVADSLSRMHSFELMVLAVSSVSTELMAEIRKSWQGDKALMALITQLQQGQTKVSLYEYRNELL